MAEGLLKTAEGQAMVALGALLLVSLSLLSLLLRHRRPCKLHLPPTPTPSLPLFGHAFHLYTARYITSVQGLSRKLGPIFTLHVGDITMIFVTSAALAHEALVKNGLLFAERPQLPSRALFTSNFRTINAALYGPHWRAMRRNLVQEMLAIPKILSFKPARLLAIDHMISRILTEAQHHEGIVCLFPIIKAAMFQLLMYMCFGFHMPEDSRLQISSLLEEMSKCGVDRSALFDFYPFLRIFNLDGQRAQALRAKQVHLFSSHIEKHKQLHKLGQVAPGSYVETLLHMDASTPLSMEDLVSLCAEFLGAGTEAMVIVLEWTMAHLVIDYSIQSKLYDGICDAVGDRPVEEKDLVHIPYLQAIIRETLRLHPPVQYLLPHAVSRLCKLGGYDIPPGAHVQFHVTTISRDPEVWEEPLNYKPERFLVVNTDITGTKEMTMMPFGAGRRICPGLELASTHMELFIARLVQVFEWTNLPSGEAVDLTENPTITVRMKHSLRAVAKERRWSKVT